MWNYLRKMKVVIFFSVFVCLSILAAGTLAWITLVQNLTNEFTYEPYAVRLIKTDASAPPKPLAGAVFILCNEDGTQLGRYVTNLQGEIIIAELPSGKYYFQEETPPYGYQMVGDGKTAVFTSGAAELTVKNTPALSKLTIVKKIAGTDLNGKAYTPTREDLAFPFEFTLSIGQDATASYGYVIHGADGAPLSSAYSYSYENGDSITQQPRGTIKSGEKLYLRHGETAVIENIACGTQYHVEEKNYLVYANPDFAQEQTGDNYGCNDPSTPGHDKVLTIASGWAAEGYNTSGQIREEGSAASFENKKVPVNYAVTMSSLVVVDRILAHPEDVDYGKGFEVTVEIGGPDNVAYWYEVVHIEDTAKELGTDYEYHYDYYDRNDPGVPDQLADPVLGKPGSVFSPNTLAPAAAGETPGQENISHNLTLPKLPVSYAADALPLHTPVQEERWSQKDHTYGALMLSSDKTVNPKGDAGTIVVDLHHASAVIIYGIPVGTPYTTWQVDYRYIDGYILDSTHKDTGVILPDLDVVEDPDTGDKKLRRTRADIYNYFVLPIMRQITVEKFWEHGDNPPELRPASTTITVYDPDTNYVYDSRSYRNVNDWATIDVPKYKPGTNELIDYAVGEEIPKDYIISDISKTENGTAITNTYAPASNSLIPWVQKVVSGRQLPAASFTFQLKSLTANAPMPPNQTVTIRGAGFVTFGKLEYPPTGTDGTHVYQYTISELKGDAAGYTYDDSVYTMTAAVVEKDGKVQSVEAVYRKKGEIVSAPVSFVNQYRAVERASITVQKLLEAGDVNQEFPFQIEMDGYAPITIRLKAGESHTITDIPIGTRYQIVELPVEGYLLEKSVNASGTVPSGGSTATFTNRKGTSPPGLGELTLTKHVTGDSGESEREFRFVVQIGKERHVVYLKDGESWTSPPCSAGTQYTVTEDNYSSKGYVTSSTGAAGMISADGSYAEFTNHREASEEGKSKLTVTKQAAGLGADLFKRFHFTVTIGKVVYQITVAGGESYTFYDIPVNVPFAVQEESYVEEGYTTDSTGSTGTIVPEGNTAVFTNTKEGTIDPDAAGRLTVTKTVTGKFVDTTKRFRFTVTIGDKTEEIFLRHGESRSFEGIPSGTSYRVIEDDYFVQDYVTSSTGAVGTMTAYGATAAFTNEYTSAIPPKPEDGAIQINGKKIWVHGSNQAVNYPQAIVVYVMNGANIVAQKTVTPADNWGYAFNLPKLNAAGEEIVYSINEEPVKSYLKSIQGYDITNTYNAGGPETGYMNQLWIWFVWLAVGTGGLWYTLFHKKKRRQKP